MRKIQLINFRKDKTLFIGPENKLTAKIIKLLIQMNHCKYENDYGVRILENDICVLLLTPEEFYHSEV